MTSLKTKNSGPRGSLKTGTQTLRVKNRGDDGTFSGYGSVFGNLDSYGDIVAAGAFDESLKQHKSEGTLPALLWQHDPTKPIGVYTEMREDDHGLWVEGKLSLDTQLGKEAHSLLKDGALNGLSIGYVVSKYEVDEDEKTFTLTEIDLWEVSLVTFPANERARVEGVKARDEISGLASLKACERYLRDVGGFSQRNATAMVSKMSKLATDERDAQKALTQIQRNSEKLLHSLTN